MQSYSTSLKIFIGVYSSFEERTIWCMPKVNSTLFFAQLGFGQYTVHVGSSDDPNIPLTTKINNLLLIFLNKAIN